MHKYNKTPKKGNKSSNTYNVTAIIHIRLKVTCTFVLSSYTLLYITIAIAYNFPFHLIVLYLTQALLHIKLNTLLKN